MSRLDETTSAGASQGFTRRRFLAHSRTALLTTGLASTGIAGSLLAACGGSSSSSSGPVEVTYTYPIFTPVPDVQLVTDAINATSQFKNANLRIKLNPIDDASYNQKIQLGYAAGTRYDLIFTAPWANNYVQNALQGNFMALDDMLKNDTPALYKIMSADLWNATRVNGKIYSIPNVNFFAFVFGLFIQPDLAKKYQQYLPETVHGYADIEPFLAQIKAHEPDVTPVYMADGGFASGDYWTNGECAGFDTFSDGLTGIRPTDTQLQVLNMYETPEFAQLAQLRWRWAQEGYTKKDQVPGATGKFDVQNGKYALLLGQQCKPNDIPFVEAFYGVKFLVKPLTTPFLGTTMVADNMNAVARSSAHPVEALKVWQLVNTDPEIFNLLCHGIEGKHYAFVDKAKKLIGYPSGITATSDRYNPDTDWEFGNEVNGYYTDPNSVGIYDQIQQANASAQRSAAFGFTFDTTNVKTEVAQVSAVITPLTAALNTGRLNPATTLPNYLHQLKQAGADTIVAEAQKQLNAWAKSQGK